MQAGLIIPLVPDTSGELSTSRELCTDFIFVFQDYFVGTVVIIAPIRVKPRISRIWIKELNEFDTIIA